MTFLSNFNTTDEERSTKIRIRGMCSPASAVCRRNDVMMTRTKFNLQYLHTCLLPDDRSFQPRATSSRADIRAPLLLFGCYATSVSKEECSAECCCHSTWNFVCWSANKENESWGDDNSKKEQKIKKKRPGKRQRASMRRKVESTTLKPTQPNFDRSNATKKPKQKWVRV